MYYSVNIMLNYMVGVYSNPLTISPWVPPGYLIALTISYLDVKVDMCLDHGGILYLVRFHQPIEVMGEVFHFHWNLDNHPMTPLLHHLHLLV